MKVLALCSSPRPEGQSKTTLMLNHLVSGMRDAGAVVEVIELRKKDVKHCIGCFSCWTKTPGQCIHQDDMSAELYPKWLACDLVVYASPLYHFTINASMKAFIERTLPVLEPFFEDHKGATKHPLRHKHPAVAMLSVAGFPEMAIFDLLSSWARYIFGAGLVAEIYRPAAEVLNVSAYAEKAKAVLEATAQAGRELAASMKISSETMTRIHQPIVEDKQAFYTMGNLMWKTCLAQGITPKEFNEKGIMPRPDSIETFMMVLSMGFHKTATGDTRATIAFVFSGEITGACHFKISRAGIESFHGKAPAPDLTIETPFEVWMDIMTGKADGQQMFMEQKYRVSGDLSLLMRMGQFFGKQAEAQ
jgi:multimeric flavodoxin WrbA/putative sterol carrier protein